MPFNWNGSPQSIPGTDALKTNIAGPAFGNIDVPTSCGEWLLSHVQSHQGIDAVTHQIRIDGDLPFRGAGICLRRRANLNFSWDFNGVFPGSGSGNAGLDTAVIT